MKNIVKLYIVSAVLLVGASAASYRALHEKPIIPSVPIIMDCCDDPPPCDIPGYPPCPSGN